MPRVRVPAWWPPSGSSKQFRIEKWFWRSMLVPVGCWAELFPHSWNTQGVLVVAVLSVYALDTTAGSKEQAAAAKEKVEEEGSSV